MNWTMTSPLALMLSLMIAAPALAKTEAAPETPARPTAPLWLISCSNQQNPDQLVCEFSQSIMLTELNQRVATASFTRAVGHDETNAAFMLPAGVSLPAGIAVSVDDAPVGELTYQSCDAQGCYATGSVDHAWLKAMRAGRQLVVGLTSRDGQAIRLVFQLDGFSKAESMLP